MLRPVAALRAYCTYCVRLPHHLQLQNHSTTFSHSSSSYHCTRKTHRPCNNLTPRSNLTTSTSCQVTNGDQVANDDQGRSRGSLFFPRRAVMYVPASDERKVMKTTTIAVDSLIFDLEDGVAVNKKVRWGV